MSGEYIITKENFEVMTDTLIIGCIAAQNYNDMCFGTSDLGRARALKFVVGEYIKRFEDSGYCPLALLHPMLIKRGYDFDWSNLKPDLKKELDDNFKVDLSDFIQAMSYSEAVYKNTLDSIEQGLMKYR